MKNKTLRLISAGLIAVFGLLTFFMSTSVIFDLFGIREKEGNYVLFVVIANFICGILYIASAWGFVKDKRWTFYSLSLAFLILVIAYIGLYFHINSGGIFEEKTVKAMAFRTILTLILTAFSYFSIFKTNNQK